MTWTIIFKFTSLVLSIWMVTVNFGKIYYKQALSKYNIILMAISISLFVFLQFHLY